MELKVSRSLIEYQNSRLDELDIGVRSFTQELKKIQASYVSKRNELKDLILDIQKALGANSTGFPSSLITQPLSYGSSLTSTSAQEKPVQPPKEGSLLNASPAQ